MQPENIFECNYSTVHSIQVSGMCFNLEATIKILLQFFEASEVDPMLFVF